MIIKRKRLPINHPQTRIYNKLQEQSLVTTLDKHVLLQNTCRLTCTRTPFSAAADVFL